MTSDDLPTTVDYTNILVNYVEVSLDQVPQSAAAAPAQPPAPSRPMDIRPKPAPGARDPVDQVRNTPPQSTHEKPQARASDRKSVV